MPNWMIWPFLACLIVSKPFILAHIRRMARFNEMQLRVPSTVNPKRVRLLAFLPLSAIFTPVVVVALLSEPLAYWLGQSHLGAAAGQVGSQCHRRTCDFFQRYRYLDDSNVEQNVTVWFPERFSHVYDTTNSRALHLSVFDHSWARLDQELIARSWRVTWALLIFLACFGSMAAVAVYYRRKFYRSGDVVGELKYW
jgi:hypothetical protein